MDGVAVDESLVHTNEKGEWGSVAPITPLDAGQPGYGKYEGADVLLTKIMGILLAKAELVRSRVIWSSCGHLCRI